MNLNDRIYSLASDLEESKQKYSKKEIEYNLIKKQYDSKKKLLSQKEKILNNELIVRKLLEQTSLVARERARTLLEDTTTTVLQYVFGESISCSIELGTHQSKPSANIYINTMTEKGIIKREPQNSCGGGIVDIVSIALRIAYKRLLNINGPIILDEPGKHVSKEYSLKLAEFLQFISNKLNTQIIFVTHNEELAAISNLAFETKINRGNSITKEITTKE